MSKADKTIKKWLNNTPTDAPIDRVTPILDRFFGKDHYEKKSGSHIVVSDERLKGVEGYGPDGDFSVPVKSGQKVKGCYLKRIAQTIDYLRSLEE